MIDSSFANAVKGASVYQVAIKTPLLPATAVSEQLGRQVLVKREDLQPVRSFKCRGSCNRIAALVREGKVAGVAAASAGNHAQGVAISARHFDLPAVIAMPSTTPDVKIEAVRRLGAETLILGDSYDETATALAEVAAKRGLENIPPFDNRDVICGQGTVAVEILQQHPQQLDAVFVPVGGGGLLAGMAAYIKAVRPEVRVIGVEPEDSACGKAALDAGKRVTLDAVGLFTDGVAVRTIGEQTFPLIEKYCDEIITVSIDQICVAIRDLFEEYRAIAEPAGALALAGIRQWVAADRPGQVLAAVFSGGNTNFERLGHIVERAVMASGLETLLQVRIPEQPGSFLKLCDDLGDREISEFNYRYHEASSARVFIGLKRRGELSGGADPDPVLEQLRGKGYECTDLSGNEMARTHLRYMIGGHSRHIANEAVYSFVFAERPAALKEFLHALGGRWNISLFHYRNHASAYGRVLAGFELGDKSPADLEKDLARMDCTFQAESANPAYLHFLN